MKREQGVVKWFSTEKGYGFIRRESGEEVFVHHTDIDVDGYASLRNGESVEFEIFNSDRGPKARKLVSLERPEEAQTSGAAGSDGPAKRSGSKGRGPTPGEARTDAAATPSRSRGGAQRGGLRPLADQLREALGGRFPGFGG
jgi:CspA family cold shock protein